MINDTVLDNKVQQQLKAGVEAHVRGNLLAAENAYKAVLNLDEANAIAHNNLGFIYGQQERWEFALEHLHLALNINPEYATALSNLGQIYFSTGARDKAFEYLEKAVVLGSEDAQNWHNLARIALLIGNFQRAEYAWWRAYSLRPGQVDYAVNMGIAVAAQHRFAEAEKIYQSALEQQPQHFNALLQLGICWLLMKNYGNAKQILLRARQLNAADPSLLRHLALVELTLGNKPAAAAYFKSLVELSPEQQSAHLDYALVLLDLQDYAALEQECNWLQSLVGPDERTSHYLVLIRNALDARDTH